MFRSQGGLNFRLNLIPLSIEEHKGDGGPHKNRQRDLELKQWLQEQLFDLFDRERLYTLKEIAVKLGKTPVQVEEAPGFVVNRILIPEINEGIQVYSEGVSNIAGIDSAMKLGANHPMGPLELGDFIGLDIVLAIMEVLYAETGDSKYRPAMLLKKMVRGGHLGAKTGRGFYVYNADRTKTPVDEL